MNNSTQAFLEGYFSLGKEALDSTLGEKFRSAISLGASSPKEIREGDDKKRLPSQEDYARVNRRTAIEEKPVGRSKLVQNITDMPVDPETGDVSAGNAIAGYLGERFSGTPLGKRISKYLKPTRQATPNR
jgi:hypothetical protein